MTFGTRLALLPAAASRVKTRYRGRQPPQGTTATRFDSSGNLLLSYWKVEWWLTTRPYSLGYG